MSEQGKLQVTFTKSGLRRYRLEIWHKGLNKYEVVKGDDSHVVEQKALAKMAQWDEMWEKRREAEEKRSEREQRAQDVEEKKGIASERTEDAQRALSALEHILDHTLRIDDTIDWNSLKSFSDYPLTKPLKPLPPSKPTTPKIPREPQRSAPDYQVKAGFFDALFPSQKEKKEKEAEKRFNLHHQKWRQIKEQAVAQYKSQLQEYEKKEAELETGYKEAVAAWEAKRAVFLAERDKRNEAVEQKRAKYLSRDPDALVDYCDLVLSRSEYPDYFPQTYDMDYNTENRVLVLDYQLPPVTSIPTVREVKYIQSRDEFDEKSISQAQLNRLYDGLLYQIALRTVHELFEADKIDALGVIAFNGYVRSIDPATGQEVNACILSFLTGKEEFEAINLANVDPKACFKMLKGVGSSKLHSLTPVAPVLQMEREDSRFVDAYAVADGIREGDNLAAMDWEDFEHLVRELFEWEFSGPGSEVKVTRASRDGGIDAVVFDPDPLRGGKIVVQAKRYTAVVDVSAVRDLYGTVINEGASKGILITTANYGPDSYEFAKGKPLVLLSGNNLLHLLEKHGHKAYTDLKEAKKILADSNN